MKLIHVRVLLDVQSKEWFHCQASRQLYGSVHYATMATACIDLLEMEMVKHDGDNIWLTQKGKDFLEGLEQNMSKYSE